MTVIDGLKSSVDHYIVRSLSDKADRDGSICKRRWQGTNSRDDFRAPHGIRVYTVVAFCTYHEGAGPYVACVQDPGQRLIAPDECIGFVDDDRRLHQFDNTKNRCRRNVRRGQRPRYQIADQLQRGCLAASPVRRQYGKHRRNSRGILRVSVKDPQCYCLRRTGRKYEIPSQ